VQGLYGADGVARIAAFDAVNTTLIFTWTAYVAERLLIGHWSVLVAYACLPWIVAAGLRVRAGTAGGWHCHLTILVEKLEGRTPPAFWDVFRKIDAEYADGIPRD